MKDNVYVAVDGVVEGVRLWVEEQPWWVTGGHFPIRNEDGMLDWETMDGDERHVVRSVDRRIRELCGILSPPPAIPKVTPGIPSPQGWAMPIGRVWAWLKSDEGIKTGRLEGAAHVMGGFEIALRFRWRGAQWMILRADRIPWASSRLASFARVPSIWVDVLAWQIDEDWELANAVPPPSSAIFRAQLRTIDVNKWFDKPVSEATVPGAGIREPVQTPVQWDGKTIWYHRPDILRGISIPLGSQEAKTNPSLARIWDRAQRAVRGYRYTITGWDR
jgi:hypothetical protein